jgi:hypothetical protein
MDSKNVQRLCCPMAISFNTHRRRWHNPHLALVWESPFRAYFRISVPSCFLSCALYRDGFSLDFVEIRRNVVRDWVLPWALLGDLLLVYSLPNSFPSIDFNMILPPSLASGINIWQINLNISPAWKIWREVYFSESRIWEITFVGGEY